VVAAVVAAADTQHTVLEDTRPGAGPVLAYTVQPESGGTLVADHNMMILLLWGWGIQAGQELQQVEARLDEAFQHLEERERGLGHWPS
jgi:hypothetical protein